MGRYAFGRLESLGMAKIQDSETNHGEIARVSGTSVKEKRLSAESIKAKSDYRLLFNGKMTPVMPMPYVRNGPPNQSHFQSHFIKLQINGLEKFDKVSVLIFNNRGIVIWESENYQNDWAGRDMKNQPLMEGIYYYVVTRPDEMYKGWIYLTR